MENVKIWYLTDHDDGAKMAQEIGDLGLDVNLVKQKTLKKANIQNDVINIFIFDQKKQGFMDIVAQVRDDNRLEKFLKFVVVSKREVRKAVNVAINIFHVEFIARPLRSKEFILLLEKSIIVERYREMMRYISREAGARIEAYENLMDINRKDIFESEKEKESFEKILDYEKHLLVEQVKLNKAIKRFTLMRQKEMFDIKNRVKAEEMLADLRRKEMMDAQQIIRAQEALIDYSSRELKEASRIIDATEKVQELSRSEALQLHEDLAREKERNAKLAEELTRLKKALGKQ